jgi:uncharacterized protein DUF6279
LVVLAAALAAGCSTMRFAYENADAYARWKIASYVDLDEAEAEELDERVEAFHAWHRKNALPKYAALAGEAAQRFVDGVSRRDLAWSYDSVRAQARESLRKAAELAAPVLDRLTPAQIAQIERRLAEENRQFYRDHLRGPERERRRKRAKALVNRLEDWVGKLTPAQLQRVRDYADRAPIADELRDRDRKRLQDDVLAILRAREAQKRLPERLAHWEHGREPAYVAALDAWREHYFDLMFDLDRMLTAEQRARAQSQLRRYAEDFEALALR